MGRVLFVACTNVGEAMIEGICNDDSIKSEIVGIVNLNTKRALNKANYRTYLEVSEKYGIPLHYCDNVNDEVTLNWIKEKSPDLIIQTGWSQKFRDELLSIPKYGCIGEHPAPLPRGRGAACVNWAILTGETSWGDTFFKMVEQYDRGEVYAQEFFNIEEYDTVKTIYDKVAACSKKIALEKIDKWSNGLFETIELDESTATYYKRRTPDDGRISFELSAKKLHDFIRAQTEPYPGAFFELNNKRIYVLLSKNTKKYFDNKSAGEVIESTENGGLLVACGDGIAIELLRYKTEDGTYGWFSENEELSKSKRLKGKI